MNSYKQLTLSERRSIEEGLNGNVSMRRIGEMLSRPTSTIAREVKVNRQNFGKATQKPCTKRHWCKQERICADTCPHPGFLCCTCESKECQEVCSEYLASHSCHKLSASPFVCNGCKRHRYGCKRSCRVTYDAYRANTSATERRSVSRTGMDRTIEQFESTLAIIKPALSRGLSPYEISTAYADVCSVSPSTLYRWIERGYGGMANIDLERKVGFKPRKHETARKTTSHGEERSYEAFLALGEELCSSACEMDCVEGLKNDQQVLLTLYLRPSHFQFFLLLGEQTIAEVACVLDAIEDACGITLFEKLFGITLTDNGSEFGDPEHLEASKDETKKRMCLFYCDVRQSQQKGSCEKNHTELRQILPKRSRSFDELDKADCAVMMSHVNSNPRASLCGLSPIQMLKAAYGEDAGKILEAYGVDEIHPDQLCLKPKIIDLERSKRH